ncbi:MAG: hypothetical protein J7647_02110 [Cyanobacteria bacterium SBLK]|nr:hypothetical protein [Cyanobacteria bacterium SBLK]
MVNIGYRVARLQGKITRALYLRRIPQIVNRPIQQETQLDLAVYALSCPRDLPEQVASIRSFLSSVGIPEQFTIISDGYSTKECELLEKIHPCVAVISLQEFTRGLPQKIYDYAAINPMGKKLAAILSIPCDRVSIYTDSDILFFPQATELKNLVDLANPNAYYLPDIDPAFDLRIIQESERKNPINGGFILFKKKPNWDFAMERFLHLQEPPNYFTEQTMMHLTLHREGAKPFPKARYIMWRDDEFLFRDRYANQETVLRHYVTPVRHKFWCNPQYLV